LFRDRFATQQREHDREERSETAHTFFLALAEALYARSPQIGIVSVLSNETRPRALAPTGIIEATEVLQCEGRSNGQIESCQGGNTMSRHSFLFVATTAIFSGACSSHETPASNAQVVTAEARAEESDVVQDCMKKVDERYKSAISACRDAACKVSVEQEKISWQNACK
jgi:hypothetical protein